MGGSIIPLRIDCLVNAHGNVAIPLLNRQKLGYLNVQWYKIEKNKKNSCTCIFFVFIEFVLQFNINYLSLL
jgi:hypothetical protein